MFSIDQNCHSLWDVLPKLQALAGGGRCVRHFVEDVDMAYTAIGAAGAAGEPHLARERYYRDGGADWGAAVFYSEFLSRLPVDIRQWEPLTGMKTKVLARQLGQSVEDLYDEFSPGDNWQLIGSSYAGDRDHHRLIGDLSVAETAPFLREIMDRAQADVTRAFPSTDARERIDEWFAAERRRMEDLIGRNAQANLTDLYAAWLESYLGSSVRLGLTSSLLALGADANRTALLEHFLGDYDLAAGLYNEAIAETQSSLRPLRTAEGELPVFAVCRHRGHFVRTGVYLDGQAIRIGQRSFALEAGRRLPLEALERAEVTCLAGKALMMMIQVRLGDGGAALALPHNGSLYSPAAVLLGRKLAAHKLLPAPLHPIVRVRLHLLDRMESLTTPVRLPPHLAAAFGREEISAGELGRTWTDVAAEARGRLESFTTDSGRQQWWREYHPNTLAEIAQLDARRRELARSSPPPPQEIRAVSKRIKALDIDMLRQMLHQIARDHHTSQIDYWDSRGALLPWSVALGGESFYNSLIDRAEITPEPGTALDPTTG